MSVQSDALRFIPDGERGWVLRRRWQAQKMLHMALAPIAGGQPVFARLLESALLQARRGEAGFWLPVAFALQRFGSGLDLVIRPTAVEHVLLDGVALGDRRLHTGLWFVGAGNWAPICWPMTQHQVSREAAELLAQDLRYRDTAVYRTYRQRAETNRPMIRNRVLLDSAWQIDAYFERFVALFESIRENGVVRRSARRQMVLPGGRQRSWWAERGEQDIGVAIDATGRLCKLPGGQHRFAIARALGLSEVAVQVRTLHANALRGWSPQALVSMIDQGGLRELCNAGQKHF